MRSEWIIDVLADLKAFAEHNEMPATAAGLEDATLIALAEVVSREAGSTGGAGRLIPAETVGETGREMVRETGRVTGRDTGRDTGNVTQLFARRGLA